MKEFNLEQFKKQHEEKTLKEMEDKIKTLKETILELGLKMELLDDHDRELSEEKFKEKIKPYQEELAMWENAYKEKVKRVSNPDYTEPEPETVGTYKGPKMEIVDMEYKLNGILEKINKAIGNKIKWEEKKEETGKRSLQAEKTGGKFFHRIEENTDAGNIEKRALGDESVKIPTDKPKSLREKFEESIEKKELKNQHIKNPLQELKSLKEEIQNLHKEFKQKDIEAEKSGTPLSEQEIEEFNKKIEEKKKIVDNYIKSN